MLLVIVQPSWLSKAAIWQSNVGNRIGIAPHTPLWSVWYFLYWWKLLWMGEVPDPYHFCRVSGRVWLARVAQNSTPVIHVSHMINGSKKRRQITFGNKYLLWIVCAYKDFRALLPLWHSRVWQVLTCVMSSIKSERTEAWLGHARSL